MIPAKGHVRVLFSHLLDSLFPPICPMCRDAAVERQGLFCATCLATFTFLLPPFCSRCGIPFPRIEDETPHCCQPCLNPSLPELRIRSVGLFSGALRKGIILFKYQKDMAMGSALAGLLVQRFPLLYPVHEHDFILPVPLHPRRLREREFNQSVLLAKPLATSLSLPIDFNSVQRIKNTKPQSMLGEKDRKKNIKDSFRVTLRLRIKNRRILIVDDVCTTGATLEELAMLLLDQGACSVDAITVARAQTLND